MKAQPIKGLLGLSLIATRCEVFQPIEAVGMTGEEWENKAFFVAEYGRKGLKGTLSAVSNRPLTH